MWLIAEDGALLNLDHIHQILVTETEGVKRDCLIAFRADSLDEGVELTLPHEDNEKGRAIAEKALQILLRRMLVGGAEGMILCDFRKISE